MDTGEIVALFFIVLVLVLGTTFICVRCWRTVLQEMKDAQAPGRGVPEDNFTTFRNVLRASVRSSFRRVEGTLRHSFRRQRQPPRPHLGSTPPVTVVATVEELREGKSELHPKYLTRTREEGEVRENGRLEPVPTGEGASASNAPRGVDNPQYHEVESGKVTASIPSISNPKTEPSVRQQFVDMNTGYDQPLDRNVFSGLGEDLAETLPAGRVPDDTASERPPHPADGAMASYQAHHDGSNDIDKAHLETDTYI